MGMSRSALQWGAPPAVVALHECSSSWCSALGQEWGGWAALRVVVRLHKPVTQVTVCTVSGNPLGREQDGLVLQQAGGQEEMGRRGINTCPESKGHRDTGGIKGKKDRQCETPPLQRNL